jgi:hypothetical protein
MREAAAGVGAELSTWPVVVHRSATKAFPIPEPLRTLDFGGRRQPLSTTRSGRRGVPQRWISEAEATVAAW